MIVWSDIEKDALCEFLNMGMGTAAASLSSMLGQEILLSVPEIRFVTQDELEQWVKEEIGNQVVGVQQAFNGTAAGNIALLFNKQTSYDLVHELMSGDMPL
ncbi:MAG: chemotaxis protein CheC, partial [Alphaproteobacteria bacterium]